MMDVTMHLTNYALNKKRQATTTVTIVGTYNAHAAVTRTSEWSHRRQRCSPVRLWPLHCALHCLAVRNRSANRSKSATVCRFCSENFVYADTESEGSKRSLSSVLAELA